MINFILVGFIRSVSVTTATAINTMNIPGVRYTNYSDTTRSTTTELEMTCVPSTCWGHFVLVRPLWRSMPSSEIIIEVQDLVWIWSQIRVRMRIMIGHIRVTVELGVCKCVCVFERGVTEAVKSFLSQTVDVSV